MSDKLFNKLKSIGKVEEFGQSMKGYRPLPGSILPCALCTKAFLMRPYFGTPDPVCPECIKDHRESAKIKCLKCDVVVARVSPEVLESGYEIGKSAVLHTDKCGFCQPGLKESVVIEVTEWEKHVGYKKKTIVSLILPD
jgi:hypothetical protein